MLNPPPRALPPPLFPQQGQGESLMIEDAGSQGNAAKGGEALAEEAEACPATAIPSTYKPLDVADATRAIIDSMQVRKAKKIRKRKKDKKKKKLKRARRHLAEDASAHAGPDAGKGKGKSKGKKTKGAAPAAHAPPKAEPKICYREFKDHFETFYNKLMCKAYQFKLKGEKAAAKKKAEDLGIQNSIGSPYESPLLQVSPPLTLPQPPCAMHKVEADFFQEI